MLPSPDKTSGSAVKDRVAGFCLHAVCARLAGGRANSPNSFAAPSLLHQEHHAPNTNVPS